MLSTRRIDMFYWLMTLLLVSGTIVWLGDINWWDIPVLSPSQVTPIRGIHTMVGFGILMLFGTLYWHSKTHWFGSRAGKNIGKKITGLALWGLIMVLISSAVFLLYAQESVHTMVVLFHAISGLLLIIFIVIHHRLILVLR